VRAFYTGLSCLLDGGRRLRDAIDPAVKCRERHLTDRVPDTGRPAAVTPWTGARDRKTGAGGGFATCARKQTTIKLAGRRVTRGRLSVTSVFDCFCLPSECESERACQFNSEAGDGRSRG
jgi:hypothetical protein